MGKQNVMMGCYGIGISRLLGVIVEANYDKDGMIWPKEVAPFTYHLLSLSSRDAKIDKQLKNKLICFIQKCSSKKWKCFMMIEKMFQMEKN